MAKYSFLMWSGFLISILLFHITTCCKITYSEMIKIPKMVSDIEFHKLTKICDNETQVVCTYEEAVTVSKIIFQQVEKIKEKCCEDYKYNQNNECEPICTECQNGICIAPNVCQCNHGYDQSDNGECTPICVGCKNGVCLSPGKCECDPGYTETDHGCLQTLKVSCDKTKWNDNCECLRGYTKNLITNVCEKSTCLNCLNGDCLGPDICKCHEGYLTNYENNGCEPYCTETCENGVCIAPNTCKCIEGLEFKENSKTQCELEKWESGLFCATDCGHGACVGLNTCYCFTGYHYDTEAQTCVSSSLGETELCNDFLVWLIAEIVLLVFLIFITLAIYNRFPKRHRPVHRPLHSHKTNSDHINAHHENNAHPHKTVDTVPPNTTDTSPV